MCMARRTATFDVGFLHSRSACVTIIVIIIYNNNNIVCASHSQVLGLLVTYFILIVQFGVPFGNLSEIAGALINDSSSATTVHG